MKSTTLSPEKGTEQAEGIDCDSDYCDGPNGDILPCFACFDPDREYESEGTE